MGSPEPRGRKSIDAALTASGWVVQDFEQLDLCAGKGIAVREFPLERGHGHAVDGKLAGVVEAKKEGTLLTGIEVQSEKYSTGVPVGIPAHVYPLRFLFESTGVETQLEDSANLPDPDVIAGEIADDLRAALEQFEAIQTDLARSKRA